MRLEDLRIETGDSLVRKGGQHVGVIPRGVTITHLPTGIAAHCNYERSQMRNKEVAMQMIEFGLMEIESKL